MNMQRWAILDSGVSSHFLTVGAPLLHKRKAANPITVTVANGERVQITHDGALDIPGLPPDARYAHGIPGIKHPLLSIIRLCNAGCEIVFGRWGLNVEVRYKGKVVMKGRKARLMDYCMYQSRKSPVRITMNGLMRVRLTPANKAKRLPPKPPNVKSDFRPPRHRNTVHLHSRNPQESTK